MKLLAQEFNKDGFHFKLLPRDGNIALLRKTKPGSSFESFEVVVIRRYPAFQIEGRKVEAGEMMPSSETWGLYGWTFSSYDDDCVKFNQLKQSVTSATCCPKL